MQAEPSAKRAYGSGSIIERRGDYYGKWRADGRQVWRLLGPKRTRGESDGLTRAQAEARLRELMAAHSTQATEAARKAKAASRPKRTIADLSALYLAHAREHRGLKSTTLGDYEMVARIHLTPYFAELPVEMIDARRVEAFAKHLRSRTTSGLTSSRSSNPTRSPDSSPTPDLAATTNSTARSTRLPPTQAFDRASFGVCGGSTSTSAAPSSTSWRTSPAGGAPARRANDAAPCRSRRRQRRPSSHYVR